MFRIFRDVRFSPDKSPYKVNFGGFIVRGGRKGIHPGYYFHFEPGSCMLSSGVYMPQPDVLKQLRDEVYFNSAELKGILSKPSFRKYFDGLDDFDKMKKPPKDYPADFPDIEMLKHRSYLVTHMIADEVVKSPDYLPLILDMLQEQQPFMAFLNRAFTK
jgi:uncharacterized protein (TIGR02453 family)